MNPSVTLLVGVRDYRQLLRDQHQPARSSVISNARGSAFQQVAAPHVEEVSTIM